MAAARKPPAPPPDPDPVGTEIAERVEATDRLLRAHKFRHAALVVAAQDGDEDGEAVTVLQAIAKLELQVANMKAFIRVRAITRRPL